VRGQPVNAAGLGFFQPEEPFAACDALRAAQREVDRRLVDLCVTLTTQMLDLSVGIQRSNGVQFETVTRFLAHLIQHQIHHRGQAHAMLAGTTVKPPQLDEFFCAAEADLRRTELAELGFTEAMIWGTPSATT
jgi:uncharacterized damage-inducible protein DinB